MHPSSLRLKSSTKSPPVLVGRSVLSAHDGSFCLNGTPRFLLAAELHYFRVPHTLWDTSLAQLKALGCNAISSYLPWSWHEPEEGQCDFTGATHPRRNLAQFLELVRKHGLVFLARPGPFIYAEFLGLGYPRWLARRYPELIARRPDGTLLAEARWETISFLHPTYQRLVRRWYQAVVETLTPFWHDPVVTFQLDNETGLMYAHRLGELDFNPHTVDCYQRFLARRYQTIAQLNARWHASYRSFEEILPPRRPLQHFASLAFQEFLEQGIADYLAFLKATATTLGVPVPLTHNEQTTHHSPAHVALKRAQVDWIGYDLYLKFSNRPEPAEVPFANTSYPAIFAGWADATHPLWAPEVGMGWFRHGVHVGNDTIVQAIMGSVAHGVQGLTCYIAQDGVEPDGTPYRYGTILNQAGQLTERGQLFERLGPWLHEAHAHLHRSTEVHDPIGFCYYYPNFRVTPAEYLLGHAGLDPVHYLAFLGHFGFYALLTTAQFAPNMIHVETAPLEELMQYRVLICPTKGYLDAATAEKLQQYVESGGDLLVFPELPRRTWEGDPLPLAQHLPARRETRRLLGEAALKWRMLWDWGLRFQGWTKPWLARRQPTAMHVIELVEPWLIANRVRPRGCLLTTKTGLRCRGDYVVWTFMLNPEAERLFTMDGRVVGFRTAIGRGRCTVIGTCLGGSYVTPWYYRWPADTRRQLRDVAMWLMAESGIERRFDVTSEDPAGFDCQIVTRRLANGGSWLFFLNRLGAQRGTVQLRPLTEFGITGHVRTVFSGKDSAVRSTAPGALQVSLAAQDVLVVEVT